ncbi:MAG: class I SAM-dependent methyltransferase [Acetobacteraceae bacterium]
MPSDPLPFDPHRFITAAGHYRAGRVPYPPALIRRVAEAVGLRDADRVLDLGCGPGQLAIGFGYFAGDVIGLDPEPGMLAAATAAALGLTPNVQFRQGSSYSLAATLGRFRLVTMGRSFHWMDRAATLERLDQLIERDGAVALFHDTHLEVPENDWRNAGGRSSSATRPMIRFTSAGGQGPGDRTTPFCCNRHSAASSGSPSSAARSAPIKA